MSCQIEKSEEDSPRVHLEKFKKELKCIINKHSMENFWDMPDFIMADMITNFIISTGHAMKNNLNWHGCGSVCHPKKHN